MLFIIREKENNEPLILYYFIIRKIAKNAGKAGSPPPRVRAVLIYCMSTPPIISHHDVVADLEPLVTPDQLLEPLGESETGDKRK